MSAAAASALALTGLPARVTGGIPSTVVVTLRDAFGNVATSYRGTVTFSGTAPEATLPDNYTFTAADVGMHTFSNGVILRTVGSRSITARDTVNGTLAATASANVVDEAASSSLTGLPASLTAGTTATVTSTLRNAMGQIATNYRGTVRFTSTDPRAALPPNYTFTAADAGVTVEDPGNAMTNSVVTRVLPGPVTYYYIYPDFGTVTAGVPFDLYVLPYDAYFNFIAGYTAEITFASTDGAAVLPANYTFQRTDEGIAFFPGGATFLTPGMHELYVFDTATYLAIGVATYEVQEAGGSPGGGSGGQGLWPTGLGTALPLLERTAPRRVVEVQGPALESLLAAPPELSTGVVESMLGMERKQAAESARAAVDDLFTRLERDYAWLA